jgi:hypothetical protein
MIWPCAPLGSYAIIGAGAVLPAAMQSPVAVIVLVLELAPGIHALIIPLMVAVAGAVFVQCMIESRSIYSGRIHTGRLEAQPFKKRAGTSFDHLISGKYAVISAGATYMEVLRAFAEPDRPNGPIYVVAEQGDLVGVIPLSAARRPLNAPLAISTSADLAQHIEPLISTIDAETVAQVLRATGASELPVIEAGTKPLVGVAKAPNRLLNSA